MTGTAEEKVATASKPGSAAVPEDPQDELDDSGETHECASPPCALDEVDPEYRGF